VMDSHRVHQIYILTIGTKVRFGSTTAHHDTTARRAQNGQEWTVGLTVVTNGDEVPTVGPKERDLVNEIGSPRKFRIAVARPGADRRSV